MEKIHTNVLEDDSEELYKLIYIADSNYPKTLVCACGERYSTKEVAQMSKIDKECVEAGMEPLKEIVGPMCFLMMHCGLSSDDINKIRMRIREDCEPYPESSVFDLSARSGGVIPPIIYDESLENPEPEFFNPLERREDSKLEKTIASMLAPRSIEVDRLKPKEFELVLANIPVSKGQPVLTYSAQPL